MSNFQIINELQLQNNSPLKAKKDMKTLEVYHPKFLEITFSLSARTTYLLLAYELGRARNGQELTIPESRRTMQT